MDNVQMISVAEGVETVVLNVPAETGVVINCNPAKEVNMTESGALIVDGSEIKVEKRSPGRPKGSKDKNPRKRRVDLVAKEPMVRVIEGATDENPAPYGMRKDGTPAAKRGRKAGTKNKPKDVALVVVPTTEPAATEEMSVTATSEETAPTVEEAVVVESVMAAMAQDSAAVGDMAAE